MKTIGSFACALTITLSAFAHSQEITTDDQAEEFLKDYCVSLINEIAKAVNLQKEHAKRNEWDKFMEQGAWISGVAGVYGNLCKD